MHCRIRSLAAAKGALRFFSIALGQHRTCRELPLPQILPSQLPHLVNPVHLQADALDHKYRIRSYPHWNLTEQLLPGQAVRLAGR